MTPTRLLHATLALLAAAALAPALASAAPAVNEFPLSGKPSHLAQGPDGNIWITLTESAVDNDIAKVTPDGTVTEFDLNPNVVDARGIVAFGGELWVTQAGGVAHFAPATPTNATAVPVAEIADARAIVVGPDGNLWTASNDKAIEITAAGVVTAHTVTGMGARDLASGTDGSVYIADFAQHRIVGLTTGPTPAPTFYPTLSTPQAVAAGPNKQMAYTDQGGDPHQIGRITPGTLTPATVDFPVGTDPFGIAFGPEGAYWAANFGKASLTRLTPGGEVSTPVAFSANSGPRFLTTGPGNTLWVGLETAKKVARVTGFEATTGGPNLPRPTGDKTRPRLTKLSLPKRLRAGQATKIRVTLSEAATLTLRFERAAPGRRAKGRCVAPKRMLRKARRCTRFTAVGSLTKRLGAGSAQVAFAGRVGKRKLGAGTYRLTVTAKDAAGNKSASVSTKFAIAAMKRTR